MTDVVIIYTLAIAVILLLVDNVRLRMEDDKPRPKPERMTAQPQQSTPVVRPVDLGGGAFKGGAFRVLPPMGVNPTNIALPPTPPPPTPPTPPSAN